MTSAQPEFSQQRKGRMEQIIEAVASGLGNSVAWMAQSGVLFVVFAALWAAFAVGLVWSQGSIDQAWQWIGSLHIVVQLVIWLLFLPVMVGMWVWETTWPLIVRLLLVGGIAFWNLVIFLPRALTGPRP